MNVFKNHSLKAYNTFGINSVADFFVEVNSLSDLKQVYSDKNLRFLSKLILGEGSNILLCGDFKGLVIKINLKGTEDLGNNIIRVSAGENWHDFVMWSIDKGYNGVENLSLIPGSVGAAPIQNIGAYGVEIKDFVIEVEAFHIPTQSINIFTKEDCKFGYRQSIFKTSHKGDYIIISVTFQLKRDRSLVMDYGIIQEILSENDIIMPTPKDLSDTVIQIRKSKIPDPNEIANSGSFFKNPVIKLKSFQTLQDTYKDIPYFYLDNQYVKIPAAWLIEKIGWKGKRFSECGVHKNHALVLVNYGDATGEDIFNLSKQIKLSIKDAFNIDLEMEVNVID